MRYELVEIHTPKPFCGVVMRSVNSQGHVAGYSYNSEYDAIRAVVVGGERVVDIGTLGGRNSFASAINDSGIVVGYSELHHGSITYHAFRYEHGIIEDLGTLGGPRSSAIAIGSAGIIVGEAQRKSGSVGAFAWDRGVMTELEGFGHERATAFGVNGAGVVVGQAHLTAAVAHAVMWKGGAVYDLGTLGGNNSAALGINDDDVIVGWSENAAGDSRAFIYRDGKMEDLGGLGGRYNSARAININGVVVGTSTFKDSRDPIAACWFKGQAFDLHYRLTHTHGWTLASPKAIASNGDIVGEGVSGGQSHSFYLRLTDDGPPTGPVPGQIISNAVPDLASPGE